MVINDFLRGKIPWYIPDPTWPDRKPTEEAEGLDGEEEVQDEEETTSSWDGLDDDSDANDEEHSDDDEMENKSEDGSEINVVSEDERIEDPRPSKRVKR
jgi:hypothetical protein